MYVSTLNQYKISRIDLPFLNTHASEYVHMILPEKFNYCGQASSCLKRRELPWEMVFPGVSKGPVLQGVGYSPKFALTLGPEKRQNSKKKTLWSDKCLNKEAEVVKRT